MHLSLTTYYCSDIEELPQEAFLQFCEQIRPAIDSLRADLLPYLDGISAADLRRVATREAVVDKLANHASDYIFTQTT